MSTNRIASPPRNVVMTILALLLAILALIAIFHRRNG